MTAEAMATKAMSAKAMPAEAAAVVAVEEAMVPTAITADEAGVIGTRPIADGAARHGKDTEQGE